MRSHWIVRLINCTIKTTYITARMMAMQAIPRAAGIVERAKKIGIIRIIRAILSHTLILI
jgi:hypothetical protein